MFDGELAGEELTAALRSKRIVTTSRPTPAAFDRAYRAAFDSGATHVVSIHLSRELSGTWDSARLAAQDYPYGAVRVVDSRSTAMGLGFAVLAAARAAADGADTSAVQDAAVAAVDRTSCFFYVDTLEYLRRGGRIGTAQALFGTALSMKPILHLTQGRILPLEKLRTSSRALARMLEMALDGAGGGPVDVAVQHLAAPERAETVVNALRDRLPTASSIVIGEVGAVVGAHTGPGTVGIIIARRP
jgi:DegV family protein with EDD domain